MQHTGATQGVDRVIVKVYDHKRALGQAAAEHAAASLRRAIQELGSARIIAATGASQFEFLHALTAMPEVSWQDVRCFIWTNISASLRRILRASADTCLTG